MRIVYLPPHRSTTDEAARERCLKSAKKYTRKRGAGSAVLVLPRGDYNRTTYEEIQRELGL